ncbi:restriction endonuclease subunit M [Betaproteobacteria bacterium]|nr:restriction endonuclease subunit M [Betaproteobacteria bacterium]
MPTSAKPAKSTTPVKITSLTHEEKRKNIPSAEHESVLREEDRQVKTLRYPRNPDLDPQLVWRGKDEQDGRELLVAAPPLYIQEKVHPQALIDDLKHASASAASEQGNATPDLFSDFNGLPKGVDKTEFYLHDQNWTNRMILGDSLQVMGSLAEREGLRSKVQCVYFDPPYGIKFNSNFQWSTTSRDVKDGNAAHITREPEQVKAFRDTWRDGIHSYLSYIRDRLVVARDLLTESGSIFVQIGDENVHRVRAVMDEVFGDENFVAQIIFTKTTGSTSDNLSAVFDTILWFGKNAEAVKTRKLYLPQIPGEEGAKEYKRVELSNGDVVPISKFIQNKKLTLPEGAKILSTGDISSKGGDDPDIELPLNGKIIRLSCKPNRHWKPGVQGIRQLWKVGRLLKQTGLRIYKRYFDDFPYRSLTNIWSDTRGEDDACYVVQTDEKPIERCILMTTDPGDLVLDPTCGSGTSAYVAEQWGRRWITIDTSRVALALARARIMGARYPYYLLADSAEGRMKEAALSGRAYVEKPTYGKVRQGFVYERVPHITLKSIANNAEIDVIWETWQQKLEPLRENLNKLAKKNWQEWEVPHEPESQWSAAVQALHADFWTARIARQQEIDASIAAKAEFEYLYDKPYEDKKTVRVAGPFTVESLSPHRMLGVDENDEIIDPLKVMETQGKYGRVQTFDQLILENLKIAGVQQANKQDRITFTNITGWPGYLIGAEGRYVENTTGGREKRAAILIGPEFGALRRADLTEAAREAGESGFDVLIALAFNFDVHTSELEKLGRIPILKARMNADLHMAADLKASNTANLFVIFGEPDITLLPQEDGQLRVKVNGIDIFDPSTGEVRSDEIDSIACWMVDTDYNGESFFVRHAYFLGQNDPYKALKTSLKAEIDPEAWASLNSDTSRPFAKPESGRIAVKVINHLGDEVMKVFRV